MRSCIDFVFCAITGLLLCALKVPAEMVRGIPGVDYPNYHTIPSQTSFKCSEQKYFPGFYADVETDCQVFHFCFDNRYESFLCPTGTTFNQPILACDMWYNSNCTLAPLFYVMNAGPGIESAEKRIPMLLKLRDQAEDGVTTMASVSSVFQQMSGLNKENVHETPQILDEGTATVTIDDLESESNVGDENETDSKISGAIKFEKSISDIQEDSSAGHLKTDEHQYLINALYSRNEKPESQDELNDESKVPELIYDPVTDGYYTQNDYSSDSEWPSESQPNSQYQGFYDFRNFNNQMMKDGESVQFPDGYVDAYADEGNEYSEQNENPPENIVFDRNYMRNGEYYEENEFAKRLQVSQIPKYSRRKPTYTVVDQPEMSQTRQGLNLYPGLGSTESPYAESISIDSVVDESSTEFMEFEESEDKFKAESERKEPNAYFENDYSEDSNLNSDPHSNSESGSDSDVVEDDWETSEAEIDKFQESEDSSFNTESNLSEVNKSYLEENEQNSVNAEESESEDITIYDDSYPQVYDGVEQNVASDLPNEQDTLIVIPDETDFPTTPKVDEIGSSNDNYEYEAEDPNQNWQYAYSETGETSQNINPGDARYMYNEIEGNEQGASEMEYSETYDPSQYAEQRNRAYPGIYDDINYSRYQPPVYADQQTSTYEPGSYYQYVPQDREYFSEQGPPEKSYQMPEGNLVSEENPEFSEYGPMTSAFSRSPNTPGNLYSYQSPDEQSYGYNYVYPQIQDGYQNEYPYSAQYGYPQNSDGNLYSNEGSERQSSFENEYVTESSDTGLPLDQEYEGLQQTWAQTDFESENSESKSAEEAETNSSEFETAGYTSSYKLGSERQNSEFNVQDSELLDNFQDTRQNEETYYVIEDEANSDVDSDESSNFDVRETTDGIETESNKTSDVDHGARTSLDSSSVVYENMEKDTFDSFEPFKANIEGVYSDSESMLNIPDEGKRDDAVSEFGIKMDSESFDKNSNPTDSWQSQEFVGNRENAKPVTASSTLERLAGLKPNIPAVSDFVAPTETRFLNSMQYPNTMNFSPYGYGTNMGQQFSMMDSQNRVPFSETENRIPFEAANSDMSRLSKLSTLQDKVRSMKGGKFGMFKKYMNSMKNQ